MHTLFQPQLEGIVLLTRQHASDSSRLAVTRKECIYMRPHSAAGALRDLVHSPSIFHHLPCPSDHPPAEAALSLTQPYAYTAATQAAWIWSLPNHGLHDTLFALCEAHVQCLHVQTEHSAAADTCMFPCTCVLLFFSFSEGTRIGPSQGDAVHLSNSQLC